MKKLDSILLFTLIAARVTAYDHPLGSSAIREAHFIGSGDNRFAEYLTTYIKSLPAPKTGPHVAQIEVRTPFAQVIVSSHEHSVGYSASQARQDYQKNPDTLQVRVQIRATATFAIGSQSASPQAIPPPACQGVFRVNSVEDCFRNFQFRFRQGEDIKPKSSYGIPISSDYLLIGADLWFTFSTADIASAPFQVTVSTPDGQQVSAEFDLASLR